MFSPTSAPLLIKKTVRPGTCFYCRLIEGMDEGVGYFKTHLYTLKGLKRAKLSSLSQKLSILSKEQVKFLVECAFNILKGILPLTNKELSRAKKFKPVYQLLTKKTSTWKKRKEVLVQNPKFAKSLISVCESVFSGDE